MKYSILFTLLFGGIMILNQSCSNLGATSNSSIEAAQVTPEGLSWYKIEDLEKLDIGEKRVMIDMYTDWCGWCKVMDKKTFTDPEVVAYLKENFVLVKFNAEQKEPITYQGETYDYTPMGRKGANKLAIKMLSGRLAYPSFVYLNSKLEKIKSVAGYKKPHELLRELQVL